MRKKGLVASFLMYSVFSFAQTKDIILIHRDTFVINGFQLNENRFKNRSIWLSNKSISTMNEKEMSRLPVRSIAEALQFVAGVSILQRGPGGTQADLSIDGGSFDQSLVLINGIKSNDVQTGHHQLNLPFPMIAVKQVEVYKGAQTRMFGPGALTGAVNFVVSPQQDGLKFHAYAGSNFKRDTIDQSSYINQGVQASYGFKTKKMNHLIAAAFESGTGYRYNSAFNRNQWMYASDYTFNPNHKIEFLLGFNYNQFGANAFYVPPIRPDTFSRESNAQETVQTLFTSLQSFHKLNKWKLNPRLSFRKNNDDYIFIRQKPKVFRNIHITQTTQLELHASRTNRFGELGLGVEGRMDEINSTNLGLRNRNNAGVYAEQLFKFGQKVEMSPGVYANYNSDFGFKIFPSFDAHYLVSQRLKIYTHSGTSMRNPTYTDWFYKGPSNDGNPLLLPEQSFQTELGIKTFQKKWNVNTYGFYRNVDQLISWVRPNNVSKYRPENILRAQTIGAHFSLKTQENKVFNLLTWSYYGGYTYLNTNFMQPLIGETKYEDNSLRHQWVNSLNLLWQKRMMLSLNYRLIEHQNSTQYGLLDTRISFKHNDMTVYVDVNNLLDVQYTQVNSIPLPGKWFTFGLKYKY
jgi:vitamin B12 transporter